MKINIHAIGHLKSGPEHELIKEYQKRLRWQLIIREFQSKKSGSTLEIQQDEAKLLLHGIEPNAFIIALDERGQALNSVEFANLFQDLQNQSQSECFILIGGADGLAPEVRTRADKIICFGKMTWPHKLVRTLLFEQLYRSQQIISGHPYHK